LARLGWFLDSQQRPWTATATDKGIVFRRYSSDITVTVTLKAVFETVALPKLPSHLRFATVPESVPPHEGHLPAATGVEDRP